MRNQQRLGNSRAVVATLAVVSMAASANLEVERAVHTILFRSKDLSQIVGSSIRVHVRKRVLHLRRLGSAAVKLLAPARRRGRARKEKRQGTAKEMSTPGEGKKKTLKKSPVFQGLDLILRKRNSNTLAHQCSVVQQHQSFRG